MTRHTFTAALCSAALCSTALFAVASPADARAAIDHERARIDAVISNYPVYRYVAVGMIALAVATPSTVLPIVHMAALSELPRPSARPSCLLRD